MAAIHNLLAVAALGHLAWQGRMLQLALASRRWQATTGTIQQCYVGENRTLLSWLDLDGDGARDEDGYHSANIRYSYQVGGRAYVSTRLSYRPTRGLMFADAIDQLQGLIAGREVDVFYDPDQPARSVIIPGASDDNAIRAALALVLLGVAVWAAF